MQNYVKDKAVIITGASSGIGEATAHILAESGCRVMLGARRNDRLAALTAAIRKAGGIAEYCVADVSKRADFERLVETTLAAYGRVDVLINNAADTALSPLLGCDVEAWERQIDTNLKGPLYGIAAVLPLMMAQEAGHIINIASTLAWTVFPRSAVYSAAKAALRMITEGLRQEAGPPVKSTIIYPGSTATEVKSVVPYHLSAETIARAILYAIDQPPDVDVNEVTVRPIDQPM
jgi:NADP-dependent 3-hydroxy acid dehydrogenase YdfG